MMLLYLILLLPVETMAHTACLPQHDDDTDTRLQELNRQQEKYTLCVHNPGVYAQVCFQE